MCELDDTGTYSVEITEFVKNGEKDQTDCWLEVEGRKYIYCQIFSILSNIFKPFTSEIFSEYPHSFTSQLKGQSVVEHDRCEFEIDVEAEDAEISWYRDGKKAKLTHFIEFAILEFGCPGQEDTQYQFYKNAPNAL